MPTFDDKILFENYHKKIEHPYVIYFDFEAFLNVLTKIDSDKKTVKTHKHIPYQITIYVVSRVGYL